MSTSPVTPDPVTRTVLPSTVPRRVPRRALALLLGVAVVAGGSTFATLTRGTSADAVPAVAGAPATVPVLTANGARPDGRVQWSAPLSVVAASGTLVAVTAAEPDGTPVEGALTPDGTWTSASTLLPGSAYSVTAVARDSAGRPHSSTLKVRTTPAAKVLHARVSPGDGAVVGIGMPVIVRLDLPVEDTAARALVEQRLGLKTEPPVEGSWRWMSDTEVHYRGASYWEPGTVITAAADMRRLQLPGGTWGSGYRRTQFTVGAATVSTVDVAAKTMTVTRDGTVLRVLKASMGKPGYDTRGGTHIVLEKFVDKVMDAATLGTPRDSADYYRTAVKHAVRITNSGTFTHGAPWSVKSQGVANVSHGCINLSPADAKWFHDLSRRGDLVTVVNAVAKPRLWDAGTAEWNMSYAEWKSGSALA
ncbi:MAG: Ig-like domain-containing protein [Mycobacteriales bacterium]|nr:Ig-like domain-containing protein [Mycobacteriales bacterium]